MKIIKNNAVFLLLVFSSILITYTYYFDHYALGNALIQNNDKLYGLSQLGVDFLGTLYCSQQLISEDKVQDFDESSFFYARDANQDANYLP